MISWSLGTGLWWTVRRGWQAFALNWLIQSTVLILGGLAFARFIARRGSAVQFVVYSTNAGGRIDLSGDHVDFVIDRGNSLVDRQMSSVFRIANGPCGIACELAPLKAAACNRIRSTKTQ